MVTWHGIIFVGMGKFWENLRRFAYYNRTVFEIMFIFLYALEQFGLVWFAFNIENLQLLGFIVSIFALIVLTTFSLHKLVMESRIKFLEEEISSILFEKLNLETKARIVIDKHNELVDIFNNFETKSLNIDKNLKLKKRLK